jgi:hypothetical protein
LLETEDSHEIVIVPLGRSEIGDANSDVVDEPGSFQWSPSMVLGAQDAETARPAGRW